MKSIIENKIICYLFTYIFKKLNNWVKLSQFVLALNLKIMNYCSNKCLLLKKKCRKNIHDF